MDDGPRCVAKWRLKQVAECCCCPTSSGATSLVHSCPWHVGQSLAPGSSLCMWLLLRLSADHEEMRKEPCLVKSYVEAQSERENLLENTNRASPCLEWNWQGRNEALKCIPCISALFEFGRSLCYVVIRCNNGKNWGKYPFATSPLQSHSSLCRPGGWSFSIDYSLVNCG